MQAFISIISPFLIVSIYQFFILGISYNDNSSADTLYFWVTSSLAWEFSHWEPLLYNAGLGFMDVYPSIPEVQLAAIYGALTGWPRENLQGYALFGLSVNYLILVLIAVWVAAINKSLKIPLSDISQVISKLGTSIQNHTIS